MVTHNVSFSIDQAKYRELENTRGTIPRSTFYCHLLSLGLNEFNKQKTTQGNHT